MMNNDLFYQVALTLIPTIGPVQARILLDHFGEASKIFNARLSQLRTIDGIGEIRGRQITNFSAFGDVEDELAFIETRKIRPLFIRDPLYPQRLLNCYDPPILLYYNGCADLNPSRSVAIVGTRKNTEYGRTQTENMIRDLASYGSLVVSGLAFGIDAVAHRTALEEQLPTIGVLAHGLDMIYPHQHRALSKSIQEKGGLLTEFRCQTLPDKHHFPSRNRIVAGMSDAVIVMETGIRGGSMITAELANNYNRDVFALPGRVTDARSAGCLSLIKNNKAIAVTDGEQIATLMGWKQTPRKKEAQKSLFVDLTADELALTTLLQANGKMHIDEINTHSGLSSTRIAAAILGLELKNVLCTWPGKLYSLD